MFVLLDFLLTFSFGPLAGFLLTLSSVEAISELSIIGSKFFNAQGEQVFFKGIEILEVKWLMK